MNVIHRRGEKTAPRTTGAFELPARSLFADDKSEQAKATIQRKQSVYGQSTGAVGHGAPVIAGLSEAAQKRLKAVPFSQPITPSKSSPRGSHRSTVNARTASVGAQTYQDKE